MRTVFNVFTGTLDYVGTGVVTPPPTITDSIDTEAGDYLMTEADDYIIPES